MTYDISKFAQHLAATQSREEESLIWSWMKETGLPASRGRICRENDGPIVRFWVETIPEDHTAAKVANRATRILGDLKKCREDLHAAGNALDLAASFIKTNCS